MNISYKNEFEQLQQSNTFRGEQWFGKRKQLVEEYSWAVPREDVIRYLAEFNNLLEVGAGSGYWAHLVERAGGDVRATDLDPPEETYISVENVGWSDLLVDISDSAVLMVWPPYDEGLAAGVARQKPSHILYVGEQRGGCTAEDEFFDIVEREYGIIGKIDIPSYTGVKDNFFHYARKI